MEDAVRQLLRSRGIRLDYPEDSASDTGFCLLGVAERVPEFGEKRGEPVNIWHVKSDLLPVSMAEFERWLVDAPRGRHWLLSERKMPDRYATLLPSESEIVVWGPNEMSVWLGEAILSGDLKVTSPLSQSENTKIEHDDKRKTDRDAGTIEPIIDIESWLIQKGLEEGALTYPIHLNCIIWEIEGNIVSPSGESEQKTWMVLEDPWTSSISLFDGFDNPSSPPSLRVLDPPVSKWKAPDELISQLPSILDTRRQGQMEDNDSSVRSIMLEWWRLDTSSTKITPMHIGVPAWIVKIAGKEDTVLHGINGRTFPFA